MTIDYLQKILTARVYEVAKETPLELLPSLSSQVKNDILLKREDLQPVFSFKLRGAYNKMAQLTEDQLKRGVICASAGNHAQGVALSATKLGTKAIIVMPSSTPRLKVDAVRARGGNVVLHGDSYDDAYAHAREIEKEQELTFIHPFDDPDVIAGQGTIAMEILRQNQNKIHAIFCPIGGGGLAAGVVSYIKKIRPEIKVIGVEPKDSNCMYQSLQVGTRVRLPQVGLFADGLAVKEAGAETFRICKELLDEIILVDTDDICAAIKDVFQDTRSILEPSGAASVAGAKAYIERECLQNETLVAIACGANVNFDRLRFVAERAELGERREAVFAVTVPEKQGSLKKFCECLGSRSLTEFNYRMGAGAVASIFVGTQVENRKDASNLFERLRKEDFEVLDLTDDELSKLHIRHMVGGRCPQSEGERLYRFEFPERPGALVKFLSFMRPEWNISLFHYRNHGADYARVLVGVQCAESAEQEWQDFLKGLGFPYWDESKNAAYKMFLA